MATRSAPRSLSEKYTTFQPSLTDCPGRASARSALEMDAKEGDEETHGVFKDPSERHDLGQ